MDPKYLIDVPPPTISGLLHMGHVFSYCHMDFVARAKRFHLTEDGQKEDPLLYPFCFDCNGLPTEKLAQKDKIFDTPGIVRFAENTSKMYSDLFQQIGMGWSKHHYHTYDRHAIALAEMSFHDLVKKGYAYKAVRDYFWCPKTRVSVSQAEIDEEGRYERSGEKVELRTGEGWFINIRDHLDRLRQAIDLIQWHPKVFQERLHRWLDGLTMDWSISRERNYGIHIPGEPDNIVFDTWFTSSLSPQMTWAAHTKIPTLHPPIFDARFQAHDIIRTWAFFTIVKSLYHSDQVPWKKIIISGHALDKHGHKISKTAGNFVEPHVYVEKYGMEGVRYWAACNQVGTDTRCDEAVMKKGKALLNKLVNAYRFIHGNGKWGLEDWEPGCPGGENQEYYLEWIKTAGRLQTYIEHDLNWPLGLKTLTDFFWHTYCDKWIEECKKTPIYDTLQDIMHEMTEWWEIFFPNLGKILEAEDRKLY
jgi:valyl-tRNA synthetase